MKVTENEILKELKKLRISIEELFSMADGNQESYLELDEFIEYADSPDGRMYRNEYSCLLEKLNDLKTNIAYLERPVKDTGRLRINNCNYFEMVNDKGDVLKEYHCGSGIEALI